MKLSARNQLAGEVETVDHGAVTTVVKIRLTGGQVMTSAITKEAAEELDLRAGSSATVVIKSSVLMIAVSD